MRTVRKKAKPFDFVRRPSSPVFIGLTACPSSSSWLLLGLSDRDRNGVTAAAHEKCRVLAGLVVCLAAGSLLRSNAPIARRLRDAVLLRRGVRTPGDASPSNTAKGRTG